MYGLKVFPEKTSEKSTQEHPTYMGHFNLKGPLRRVRRVKVRHDNLSDPPSSLSLIYPGYLFWEIFVPSYAFGNPAGTFFLPVILKTIFESGREIGIISIKDVAL